MENLVIEKTHITPYINFDAKNGALKIEGRSIPEDPSIFYTPVFGWIKDYFDSPPAKEVTFDFKLEYINSGSSKFFLELFRLMKVFYNKGNLLTINWHYEEDDESVMELGEHYKTSFDLPINLIEFF